MRVNNVLTALGRMRILGKNSIRRRTTVVHPAPFEPYFERSKIDSVEHYRFRADRQSARRPVIIQALELLAQCDEIPVNVTGVGEICPAG
jgi:hypothetical protein